MKKLALIVERYSCLSIEVGYNSVADWCVRVYDKKDVGLKNAKVCVSVQDCDYDLAIAKAYVDLCSYLRETRGGY